MKRNRKKVVLLFWIIFAAGIIYAAFLQYKISLNYGVVPAKNADYLIVLGAKVKGTEPSLTLASRIDAASVYLKKNPSTIVIASGGQGPGEDISEAECIKRELQKLGINESRIVLEGKSTDTYENIRFSKNLIPKSAKDGVVVTNDFHLYRALSLAADANLKVQGLPADTPLIALPKSYIREYLAITKYYLVTSLANLKTRLLVEFF
ncbi:YdcF family protein [Neobacillus citreus]|uniref:YdcF family protein n=1 Tax=Neobacillus citreus TaxID=2833578 RepID=A0A942SUS1_9BACI|nr:YdcF family protein [Neobacillus citreus]MCH6264065.1 YdcF family protein [Neobacillus citreus]